MPTGRPRIQIDKEQFEELCKIQCTLEEIAGVLKCSEDTVERWCKRELKLSFAEAFKKYSAEGKKSLRRIQFEMAKKNPGMAIWLGKQYLGQREPSNIEIEGDEDNALTINIVRKEED